MGFEEHDVEKSPTGTDVSGETMFPDPSNDEPNNDGSNGEQCIASLRGARSSLLTLESERCTASPDTPATNDTKVDKAKGL